MNNSEMYNDIINMPHHVSKKHPQMSLEARSAQFAPFSALTGYDDMIDETVRFTSERIEIDEELKYILDNKLKTIRENILNKPQVSCTYFIPDSKKEGGKYVTVKGTVKKIDELKQAIILEDKTEIKITEITDLIYLGIGK